MTESELDQDPCELCGFSASLYGLESDVLSTAALVSELVNAACEGLSAEQRAESSIDKPAIDEIVRAVEAFEGDPLTTAHHGLHAVAKIGVIRQDLGAGPTAASGTVTGLHTSGGGVPKTPIDVADVKRTGVVGDEQANRIHHGRPLQALCLWSEDVMEALRGESHPIGAGLAGENISIDGVDWATLRPGSRITISNIPILISAHATPCSKVAAGFVDRNFRRIDHDTHPGWSRLYAIPLGEGRVNIGDAVTIGAV